MFYVLDVTAAPGLVVLATKDQEKALEVAAQYAMQTGHVVTVTSALPNRDRDRKPS